MSAKNDGNAEKFKCELSDSDRFIGSINFTKEENFNYRGIQVIFISICLKELIFQFFKLKLHVIRKHLHWNVRT